MIPPPDELGLDATRWRPGQEEAIELCSSPGLTSLSMPTGSGKSYVGLGIAATQPVGERTLYLTATKGLQDMIPSSCSKLWRDMGAVDFRGKNAYTCMGKANMTCREGMQAGCAFANTNSCTHYSAWSAAARAPLVVANYHVYLQSLKGKRFFGPFDTIILDEAHLAYHAVSSCMACVLTDKDVDMIGIDVPNHDGNCLLWKPYLVRALPVAEEVLRKLREVAKTSTTPSKTMLENMNHWEEVVNGIRAMRDSVLEDWAVDRLGGGFRFEPIRISRYAARLLGRKRTVLMSATLTRKTVDMLGFRGRFQSFPYLFDGRRHPVMWIPGVRVSKNTNPAEERQWLELIDSIIGSRPGVRIVVHSGSHWRKDLITEQSQYRKEMMSNKRGDVTSSLIQRFKWRQPRVILVSPSVTTGYDLKGDLCRAQILAKMLYPDMGSALVRYRMEADREYLAHEAVQQAVQACGRNMRDFDDWGECFLADDMIAVELDRRPHLAPDYFHKLLRTEPTIPPPIRF